MKKSKKVIEEFVEEDVSMDEEAEEGKQFLFLVKTEKNQ